MRRRLIYSTSRPPLENRLAFSLTPKPTPWFQRPAVLRTDQPAVLRPQEGLCECGHAAELHGHDGCWAPGTEECGCRKFARS